jgi:hypothetical protein
LPLLLEKKINASVFNEMFNFQRETPRVTNATVALPAPLRAC